MDLLAAGDPIPDAEAKVYRVRTFFIAITTFVHLGLALVYLVIGHPVLGAINVASSLVDAGASALLRKGRHQWAVGITLVEAGIHVPVFTLLLGLRAGYALYYFAGAACAALLFPPRERLSRRVWLAGCLAGGAALLFVSRRVTPFLALEPWKLDLLFVLNTAGTFAALASTAFHSAKVTERAEAHLAEERERSERLLRNVLPDAIAERLKRDPARIADTFSSVTVLFADIVGFTELSSRVSGTELVDMLNEVFSAFDALAERHGLEKIKTIGDAYMVVGGLPSPRADHALACASMAMEMREVVRAYSSRTGVALDLRIGIHTGPVVAGVIGTKRFAYDLWGETVNTASRMESHGVPGRVQISAATRDALADAYEVTERGSIPIKGIGEMKTCFLERRR